MWNARRMHHHVRTSAHHAREAKTQANVSKRAICSTRPLPWQRHTQTGGSGGRLLTVDGQDCPLVVRMEECANGAPAFAKLLCMSRACASSDQQESHPTQVNELRHHQATSLTEPLGLDQAHGDTSRCSW